MMITTRKLNALQLELGLEGTPNDFFDELKYRINLGGRTKAILLYLINVVYKLTNREHLIFPLPFNI